MDYLTSNVNYGNTYTQVPYDSVEQIASDQQKTTNGFQTLSYFRTLNSDIDKESNLFIGAYAREGGLQYTPGAIDPRQFSVRRRHHRTTTCLQKTEVLQRLGIRSTYDSRLSHQLTYKVGFNISSTKGTENFTSHDSSGNPGPSIVTDFAGSDFGIFGQTDWHPLEWTSFELGVRYDQHVAPDVALTEPGEPENQMELLYR